MPTIENDPLFDDLKRAAQDMVAADTIKPRALWNSEYRQQLDEARKNLQEAAIKWAKYGCPVKKPNSKP